MRPYILTLVVLATLLTGCSKPINCPLCYEDEWSREPFPGQPKQHIAPLSREDVQKMEHGVSATTE